jgi:hypothetical protein
MAISRADAKITHYLGTDGDADEPAVNALRTQVNTKLLGGTALTVQVMDDDSAATNGTDVYVVPTASGLCAFYSVCAGDASVAVEDSANGDWILVTDNDNAASMGTALYFDEDGVQGARFLTVAVHGQDQYMAFASGKLIKVAYDASAASNGVAVHVDDDAAALDERLLFVSPTDTAGTETTETGTSARSGTA